MSTDDEDREIHPTHMPEPDDRQLYYGGKSCMKCMYFVQISGRTTDTGIAPCKGPIKVSLRMNAADHHAERFGRIFEQ